MLEIYQRYADGEITRTIVEDFNRRGLKTKNGKPFSPNSFNRILRNRKYIGEYQYQDVVIPGGVPAIVPDDLFYQVQARLEKNKRAPAMAKADTEYLLTTKLFCGLCERMMVGESGTSHTGAKHYYYKCAGAKRKRGCKQKPVKKDWIEKAAVILTVERVLKDEEISRIADSIIALQNSEDTTVPALKKQLSDTERGIENMLNAIQQGVLTPSAKDRLESLEKQKEDLKRAILQAEMQKPKYSKEQIISWIRQFKYGDVNSRAYQKSIFDTFINAVYLFNDRLVITYNFKGGTETTTLKDIGAACGSDLIAAPPPRRRGLCIVRGDVFYKKRVSHLLRRSSFSSATRAARLVEEITKAAAWLEKSGDFFLSKSNPRRRALILEEASLVLTLNPNSALISVAGRRASFSASIRTFSKGGSAWYIHSLPGSPFCSPAV